MSIVQDKVHVDDAQSPRVLLPRYMYAVDTVSEDLVIS